MKNHRFTVIIPEHKRPEHLRRLLDYFLSQGIKIVVVDSSDVKFKYLSDFEDKISYIFYPKMDLAQKLSKIRNLVTTPYVVMCANDDFLVPQAINKIIDFLEVNAEYNSGQGMYIDFSFKNEKIINSLRYRDTTDVNLNEKLASERYLSLQRKYFQYYYAVFRTPVFFKAASSVVDGNNCSQIKNLCLLESYISSYGAIDGKHIIMPILYSARENILDSAASNTDTIPVIVHEKKYRTEYNCYLNLLSNHLSIKEGLTYEQSLEIVHLGLKQYIKSIYPDYYSLKGKTIFSIKRIIKRFPFFKVFKGDSLNKEKVDSLPEVITKSQELFVINSYIKKYAYIYKRESIGRI